MLIRDDVIVCVNLGNGGEKKNNKVAPIDPFALSLFCSTKKKNP